MPFVTPHPDWLDKDTILNKDKNFWLQLPARRGALLEDPVILAGSFV